MVESRYRGWGHARAPDQHAVPLAWPDEAPGAMAAALPTRGSVLPFGNGRSYGDSCINTEGALLDVRGLNRLVHFDAEHGRLIAEPGITLTEVLRLIVPHGWFLPVVPGTGRATLGGAVANDVHGKNHHVDGTFGRFVERIDVLRSDGQRLSCSRDRESELFCATIGGLGLTGLIVQLEMRLLPIASSELDVTVQRFGDLDGFAALSAAHRDSHRYTVAWLDCAATGAQFGRGVFLAANHGEHGPLDAGPARARLAIPANLPGGVLNRHSIRAFNALYYARHARLHGRTVRQSYTGYFHPLDGIESWNRIYGCRGFHQYQFVLPESARGALPDVLRHVVRSGLGSFLAVLKEFGDIESPGLLSFPHAGPCLALDFAERGARTERVLAELDAEVARLGGRIYPAKDRRTSGAAFRRQYPAFERFSNSVDPAFSSDYWRRVSE